MLHTVFRFLAGAALSAAPGLALAHAQSGAGGTSLWSAWNTDLSVLLPLLLVGLLYLIGIVRLWRRAHAGAGVPKAAALAFAVGWIVAFIALVSPLDALGNQLFSAHMVQHELLMLLAAPLMVVGKPIPVWLWALPLSWRAPLGMLGKARALRWLWRASSAPLVAWSIHAAVLWVWHIPALFQAALGDTAIHTLQHLAFFLSALLFWWSMFDTRHGVPNALAGVVYIFTTAVHSSILGALLTFSNSVWYPVYAATAPDWGMSVLEDQRLGGLIMWVPGGVVFVVVTLLLLMRALQQSEARARRTDALLSRRT